MKKVKSKSGATAKESRGVQEIKIGDQRAVVIPYETWEHILEELEELYDLRCYDEACELEDDEVMEHDELCRLLGRCPLFYLRSQSGLTQAGLARKSGLSQSFIAKVEAGERCLTKTAAKKLTRALGVPLEKLFQE